MIDSFCAKLMVAACGCLLSGSAIAQQGYPLVCRGGGGMVATVSTDWAVRITFTPTAQATSVAPPQQGECGWLDRGFRPGEPALLLYQGRDMGAFHYLIDSMLGGGNFFVTVYNDNQGSMVVTKLGP